MLAKLLALLAESKGGVVAVVLLAGATTATVAATNPDIQSTFQQLTNSSNMSQEANDCDHGQPVVVAQRNAAEKLLRDAYTKDHKSLEDLRGGPGQDNQAVGAIVRSYDDQMRGVLNVALNQVAALTLGRDGQVRKLESASPSASGSAAPTASHSPAPSTSPSAKPSCSPEPSTSASASPHPSASGSPEASSSGKPAVDGRVMVAERTTLDADIQKIVDDAIKAMNDLVTKATADVAAVPAPDHGKPSDNPGNKPADNPGAKPSDAGKPSGTPSH